ncbi:MAG: chemotaxis protein CheW [Alphaproteobacteria bacterium]|uniref:Chemotaxis protein CheW n=1 Tax=Candidatus Nitrobium versatile TaxID=2884831 RepID=A0A953JAU8_9BACT|nr:chemotaxis protein CheW [Candidatus Nitrobium versatile]
MTGDPGQRPACPREIRLLTFTVGGVALGVDADQVEGFLEPGQAVSAVPEGIPVYDFHEIVPFRGESSRTAAPWTLFVRHPETPYGVLIDRPEEIVPIPVDSLQPLPPLLASCYGRRGAFWGAWVREDAIILLVDFYRLGGGRNKMSGRSEAKR